MATTAICTVIALPHPASAQSPTGGSVVAGTAGISQAGAVTNINQSSQKAIINWQGFSVGAQNTVNFNQPNSSAATLNRVIGNERSVINGAINANGQVFIVNSAGVLFGKGSQVNVGGLVASTLDISNNDFMAGNYKFSGTSSASVVNQGRIRAHGGGQGGGYVALLGKTVSNEGVIAAKLGTVAMASGEQITLNFGGDSLLDVTIDKGTLNALVQNKRAIIANGGQVIMTAKAADQVLSAQVNNSGVIQARTMAALKGGSSGGKVKIGKIKLLAQGGTTKVSGKLDASAPKGGDGGFIETSGDHVQIADDAVITTKSAHGQNGTWLIDPDGFTIATTSGDISGTTLANQLANGSVIIASTSGSGNGTNDGNININDAVTWSSASNLTLTATNNVAINAALKWSGSALTLQAGNGTIKSATAGTLTQTGAGSLTLTAAKGITLGGVMDLGNASLTATTATGTIAINQALTWSGSAVQLTATAGAISTGGSGALTQTGTGSLTLTSKTGITFNGKIKLDSGSLTATVTGTAANNNIGINNTFEWSGSAVKLTTSGGVIQNSAAGILTQTGNGSLVLDASTGTGAITLNGKLDLNNASLTASTNTGAIAIKASVASSGAVQFKSTAGSITTDASGSLNPTGSGSLVLDAGTGAITLNGAMNLGNVTPTLTAANVTFNGLLSWSGPTLTLSAPGDITVGALSWSAGQTLTLSAARDINVTAPLTWSGGLTLSASRDITVNAPLNWSGGTLTLSATNNIYVNRDLTGTGSPVGLAATYGTGVNADGTAMGLHMGFAPGGYYKVYLPDTATVSLNGTSYAVINNKAQFDAVSGNLSGHYVLGSDIADLSISDFQPFGLATTNQFSGAFFGLGHSLSFVPGSVSVSSAFALTGLNAAAIVLPLSGTLNVGGNIAASSAGGMVEFSTTGDVNVTAPLTWSGTFGLNAGGNINVNAPITWTTGTLALSASSNIFVNAAMTASGTAGFSAIYGSGTNADGTPNGIYMAMGQTNGVNNGTFVGKLNFSNTASYALNLGGHIYTVVNTLDALATATAGGFYALGSDLDHAGTDSTSTYTLSGAVANVSLAGLDGLGHTVTGVTINDTTTNHGNDGLVQQLAAGGIIRNIGVVKMAINAGVNADTDGALVGQNNGGSIVNAFASGGSIIVQGHQVGGLVGGNYGGLVANSWANVDVTGQGDVGGLVGNSGILSNVSSRILNSYAKGAVNANPAGGGARTDFGGLVGMNSASIIKNSYATGDVLSPSRTNLTTIGTIDNGSEGAGDLVNVGGLVGLNFGSAPTAATISYSWASGDVTSAGSNVGGLVGQNSDGSIDHSYATGTVTDTLIGGLNVGGLVGYNTFFSVALGGNITDSYATGDVLAPNSDNVGGIAGMNAGLIKDSQYIGGTVKGRQDVGGVAGYNSGSPGAGGGLDNDTASGTIIGLRYVGGVVGFNSSGNAVNYATINESHFLHGSVSGDNGVGGVAGYNAGNMQGSSSEPGTTVTGNSDVGGIAGVNAPPQSNQVGGTVNDTHSSSTVTGNDDATTGSEFGRNLNTDPNTVNNSTGSSSVSTPTSRAQAAAEAAAQAAAQAAAAEAAAQAAASQRALVQQGARTANAVTNNVQTSSVTPPDPAVANAGATAAKSAKTAAIEESVKSVDDKAKADDKRQERKRKERQRRAAAQQRRGGSAGSGGNFGATIRSIDVDGQRFNLQDGAPKQDAPVQAPH